VPAVFMYNDQSSTYTYGLHHPLKPVRLQLTYELIKAYDLLGGEYAHIIPATEASTDDLLRFHSAEYLDVLQAVSAGLAAPASTRDGLGPGDNPIFPDLFRYSALVAGASL
jgi:acetoin utilization protein AcuC